MNRQNIFNHSFRELFFNSLIVAKNKVGGQFSCDQKRVREGIKTKYNENRLCNIETIY